MGDPAGIRWLHLSDLYLDRQGGPTTTSEIRELIEHDLRRVHAASGPWDVVAICGSITRNGEAEEFERAGQVVDWLWTVLHRLGSEPSLVLVPGIAERGVNKQRRAYLVDERDALRREETDEPTRMASQLAEFARFRARQRENLHQRHVRSGMLPGDSSLDIDRDGLRVGVLGLDTTIGPAVDADLEAERIAAVCGADTTEWVRRSDAVIVIASHEDTLSAARFMNHGVPLVWLCRGCPQALSMRSRRGRTYLVVSSPQLFADRGGGGLASTGDPFGYSAGRLWVSDDQAHVRIWHRSLSGGEGDHELRRLGPPPDAIVDRDGAVTLSLPARAAPSSASPSRSTPSSPAAGRSAAVDREASVALAQASAADPTSSTRALPEASEMQIRHLAWSHDGQRIAAISGLRTLVLYGRDRTVITAAMIPDASAAAIAWSPDGSRLATRSRSEVHVWAANGTLLRSTELSYPAPAAMAWTATGELALGSDRGMYIWNPRDAGVQNRDAPGKAAWRIVRTPDAVLALAVSRQRQIAAIGGRPRESYW